MSSCFDGNFAIQSVSSGAFTDAFGRAPPNEEPGANNCFNHLSSSPLSSFSNAIDACSNSLREVHGGVENSTSSERNGPSSFVLNLKPPILDSS